MNTTQNTNTIQNTKTSDDLLDRTLQHYHKTRPIWFFSQDDRPLSNHGTMVAHALYSLGLSKDLEQLTTWYLSRLRPLKQVDSFYIQAEQNLKELETSGWRNYVCAHLPALLPDIATAGFHALLRFSHAIRSLEQQQTPTRLKELAYAHAYWQQTAVHLQNQNKQNLSREEQSPHNQTTIRTFNNLEQFLENLPEVPKKYANTGLIFECLKSVESFPPFWGYFEQHKDSLDKIFKQQSLGETLQSFYKFALACLEKEKNSELFDYLHLFTATQALETVLSYLTKDKQQQALHSFLLHYSALHSNFSVQLSTVKIDFEKIYPNILEQLSEQFLKQQLVGCEEAHAIKFTEALLNYYKKIPAQEILETGFHVIHRLK